MPVHAGDKTGGRKEKELKKNDCGRQLQQFR